MRSLRGGTESAARACINGRPAKHARRHEIGKLDRERTLPRRVIAAKCGMRSFRVFRGHSDHGFIIRRIARGSARKIFDTPF